MGNYKIHIIKKMNNTNNPFINRLLQDLQLDQLPEPQKTALLNKITGLAEKRILQTVIMNMDDASIDEFEQKLQSGITTEEATKFMVKKIPGLSGKIDMALRNLYEELLKDVGDAEQDASS